MIYSSFGWGASVMQTQFNVTSFVAPAVPKPADVSMGEVSELLRQSLEVQRDQLTQMKQTAAAQDGGARWRALITKWREEFPEMPAGCKECFRSWKRPMARWLRHWWASCRTRGQTRSTANLRCKISWTATA